MEAPEAPSYTNLSSGAHNNAVVRTTSFSIIYLKLCLQLKVKKGNFEIYIADRKATTCI